MAVSFFLPFYNEARILEKNVLCIYNELLKLKKDFELVLVDDSSTDNCPKIGQKLSKKKSIRYLRFDNGPSRRENLALALKEARYEIVAFSDIDLSTDLKYLPRLINEISKGVDIATGSRYLSIKPKRGVLRAIYSTAYNSFLRFYFSSRVKDHQCGFKAFRKSALISLLEEMRYDKSFRRGWFWDAELLIRAQKNGLRVSEFPVNWKTGSSSTFEISREILTIPYIFKFKEKLKRYKGRKVK